MRCIAICFGILLLLVCALPARSATYGYPGVWVGEARCIHYYEAAHHGPATGASFRRDWKVGWHLTRTAAGEPSTNHGGFQINVAMWLSFVPRRWPQDPALASRAQQVLVAWRIWVHNGRSWGANNQWPGTAAACGVR